MHFFNRTNIHNSRFSPDRFYEAPHVGGHHVTCISRRQQAYQDKRIRQEALLAHITSITCYRISPSNVKTVSVIGLIVLAALCSAASRTWLPSRVRFSAALCLPFVPSAFPPIYLVLHSIPYCPSPIPIGF